MKPIIILATIFCFLAGCKSSEPGFTQKGKTSAPPVLSGTLASKQLNGVDFFARGSLPSSWSLEMDFGNLLRFKSVDGTEANASAAQPVYVADQKATSFSSAGDVQVMLYDEPCKDALTGEAFNKRVTVTVKGKLYEGCGQYLYDATLHGKWVLQKINSRPVNKTDFAKGLPLLNLDLQKQTLGGHDGCNQLSGGFEVMGSKIRFNNLALTKMACPGNTSGLEIAPRISTQTIDYYFKDGQLYFYLQDDSLLIFSKG